MVPRRRALHGRRGRGRLDPPDPTATRIDGAADVAHGGRCGPGTRLRRDPAAPTTRELAGGPCSGAGAAGPFGASGRRARWRPSRGLPRRAREPDRGGEIERDGVRIGYDVYGEDGDDRTCIVLFTSWAIVHMRQWKLQVPFLARHYRVITVEGRGNGRADRPDDEDAYADAEYVNDPLAVMDAWEVDRAVLGGLSMGARHALQFAARYPDRAAGVVAMGALFPASYSRAFDTPQATYEGWQKFNRHYWRTDFPGWVEFFMSQVFTEPHSLKHREDGLAWGLDTDGITLALTQNENALPTMEEAEATCRAVRCPVLVVHGSEDHVTSHAR